MNLEKLMIVSRLDGYLNAVSVVKSSERNLKYAARFYECNPDLEPIEIVLLRFFESHGIKVKILLLSSSEDVIYDVESFIDPHVRFEKKAESEEFSWDVIEMIRVMSDDFLQKKIMKYSIEFDDFHGEGCALLIDQGYVAIQFLTRKAGFDPPR